MPTCVRQVSLNVTRSWAAATCAAVSAGEQPGVPWVLSAADHALCAAAPSAAADSLPPDSREFILARYGVVLLLCRPNALDRGCCPEVRTCVKHSALAPGSPLGT